MSDVKCPDCDEEMETGFLRGHHSIEWVSGEVTFLKEFGIVLPGATREKVTTYRCPKCGLLRSYAIDKKS